MMWNKWKAVILLGALSSMFLFLGNLIGGHSGLVMAFFLALIFNFISYFFSDKMVLALYKAQPLDRQKYTYLYEMVEDLCHESKIPVPRLWFINTPLANAFATGRNPQHSSVAVTQGILDLLDRYELRGVLAHEISHIKNRDILVGTIAATLATAIGYLADMFRWSFYFNTRDKEHQRSNTFASFFIALIMPLAAMLIQLALSRSREYLADETGARCCKDPLALASALEKLYYDAQAKKAQPSSIHQASTASLFIVYPFIQGEWVHLFSTHPPLQKRIERLRKMAG